MINNIIDLIASFAPMWEYVLFHVLALMFVATVPCIIRKVVQFNV